MGNGELSFPICRRKAGPNPCGPSNTTIQELSGSLHFRARKTETEVSRFTQLMEDKRETCH